MNSYLQPLRMKVRNCSQRWRWPEIAIGIPVASVVVLIAFQGWPDINVPNGIGGNLAEWSQVAGSIIAIVGAFKLGSRQHQNDRDRDAQAKLESELALKSVVDLVSTVGCEVVNACQESREDLLLKWRAALKSDCKAAIAAFDQMPLHQLGSPERITHAFRIRNCVDQMARLIETEIIDARGGDGIFHYWVAGGIKQQADALQLSMDGFAAQYTPVHDVAVRSFTGDHPTPPHAAPAPQQSAAPR